jgi:hypothetical protein
MMQFSRKLHDKKVMIEHEHHALAKVISSMNGVTLKTYLGRKIEEDARKLQQDVGAMLNRRGQLFLEIMYVGIFLCILFTILIIANISFKGVNATVQNQSTFTNASKQTLNTLATSYAPQWDYLGLFVFGGLWLFLLISTYFLDTHPLFFIVMLLAMSATFVVLMVISNTFHSLATQSDPITTSSANDFPAMLWLIDHLLEVGILVFFTCTITLYAKPSRGGGI